MIKCCYGIVLCYAGAAVLVVKWLAIPALGQEVLDSIPAPYILFFLENQVILKFLLYLKKSGGKKCCLDMLRKQAQQQGLWENAHLHQSS